MYFMLIHLTTQAITKTDIIKHNVQKNRVFECVVISILSRFVSSTVNAYDRSLAAEVN